MNISRAEFDKIKLEFLETQDELKKDEWFASDWALASHVLARLEAFLFGEEDAREARHAEYLKLKAEFEP